MYTLYFAKYNNYIFAEKKNILYNQENWILADKDKQVKIIVHLIDPSI
jgi:hypothetical protein